MPRFWLEKTSNSTSGGKVYWQRNLLNETPLPLNWPVEVNYLDAKAFCQWKNAQSEQQSKNNKQSFIRLPTEAEWICLRDKISGDLSDWKKAPGNINREYYASSCPVNQFEHGDLFDVVGNVWQWTESSIDGFQGFNVHPLYDDFSTLLAPNFTLLEQHQLTRPLKINHRNFALSFPHLTVWQLNEQ